MTPYDELIARISDLIRDGDRTVKARAEDIAYIVATNDNRAILECIDLRRKRDDPTR